MKAALCGICGEPVPHAFYDEKGRLQAEQGFAIYSEGNIAYHYEPSKDCWGKKTGYANFLTIEQMRARLESGYCPRCYANIKLVRGRTLKEKIINRLNLRKICPRCGFELRGE